MRLEASTGVSSCVENPCPPGIAFPVEQGPGRTECCRHPGVVERPEMGATENPELSRGSQGPSRGLTRLDTPAHGVHTHAHLPMPRAPRSTLQASSRCPRPPGPRAAALCCPGPHARPPARLPPARNVCSVLPLSCAPRPHTENPVLPAATPESGWANPSSWNLPPVPRTGA